VKLTRPQREIIKLPFSNRIWLEGPAGTGKTTTGVKRMLALLSAGVPGNNLLIITPQRTLQEPYLKALRGPGNKASGEATLITIGGLARRMVDLFWPVVAEQAGFKHPDKAPIFLTIETAQYHMARLVRPLLEEGFFDSVTIHRNRLYSQILDNLNKAAAVGFEHTEIGERLASAWYGDPAQLHVYANTQECARRFREHCLEYNLLDFSLQLEIFTRLLWHQPECRDYLQREYHYLIYDNPEEDIPVAHDILIDWLPGIESALVINDTDGGYRRFLGADPASADRIKECCNLSVALDERFDVSPQVAALGSALTGKLRGENDTTEGTDWQPAVSLTTQKFYPEMLDQVIQDVRHLIQDEQVSPAEIVVLAPYLSDALRFALTTRFEESGIPWRSHRPSRSLRDEPASQCLLTLAELAHQGWDIHPTKFDLAYALMQAIDGMDLVRAQLLTEIVYRPRELRLSTFAEIRPEVQERITFVYGNSYSILQNWLLAYRQETPQPLDHFLRRLFGEVLSQKGFGFHNNLDAARVAASLIESHMKFRQVMEESLANTDMPLGLEYIRMLQEGVIAAQYLEGWRSPNEAAVLIAPAHTFLMMNRPVEYQFWLDIGSNGWAERVYQPLTHPYVLSRSWLQKEPGTLWTDADEVAASRETLAQLAGGLLHRCRRGIYLGMTDLGEQGYEQRGPLLKAIWRMQNEIQTANLQEQL
jgi:hypothetical protein